MARLNAGLVPPTDSFVDNAAAGIVAHRLLLRDAKGRVVFSNMALPRLNKHGSMGLVRKSNRSFFHDPTDNVNNGLIANPFLVKQTPDREPLSSR